MSLIESKEILFKLVDINKDKRVCETDLFLCLKSLEGAKMQKYLFDDIMSIFKHMN